MRTILISFMVLIGSSVFWFIPTPAQALSCVGPQQVLQDASVVFTGKIISHTDNSVTVEVEEVWEGEATKTMALELVMTEWLAWPKTQDPPKETMVFAPTLPADPQKLLTVGPCSIFNAQDPQVTAQRPNVVEQPRMDAVDDYTLPVIDGAEFDFEKQSNTILAAIIGVVITLGAVFSVIVHERKTNAGRRP